MFLSLKSGESAIFEAEGTSKFNFTNSFPDNIAFPVKKGVQDNNDIKPNELTNDFRKFLKELKAAVENGASVDQIAVKSGASSEGANLNVPDGYTKELVIASYGTSDESKVSNEELAKNRGRATIALIKKFIPQLANANFDLSSEVGTKKYVTVSVPSSAIINVKTKEDYRQPTEVFSADKIQKVQKCGDPIEATGSAGKEPHYLADMIVLDMPADYTNKMTLSYDAYFIPDKFVVRRRKSGTDKWNEDVATTGFVTSASGDEHKALQNQLKAYFPDAELKGGQGSGTLEFTKEKGYDYAIMVYAPFGGTAWTAKLSCEEVQQQPASNDTNPVRWASLPAHKQISVYLDNPKNPKDSNFYLSSANGKYDLYWNGELDSRKAFKNGLNYEYDANGLLKYIKRFKDGRFETYVDMNGNPIKGTVA